MSTKDITDKQVCEAYAQYADESKSRTDWIEGHFKFPYDLLKDWTGQPFKVCWRAMERAAKRDLIEYGVSLRTGWLTAKGKALLNKPDGGEL